MFPEAKWNHAVKTGMKAGSGYPQCYKLDVAIPSVRLGIEADGAKHNNPKARLLDTKKDAMLTALGWKVLRYSNKEILDFRRQIQILADVEYIISTLMATQATV
jgi:very-short-patch-repair endonuclease